MCRSISKAVLLLMIATYLYILLVMHRQLNQSDPSLRVQSDHTHLLVKQQQPANGTFNVVPQNLETFIDSSNDYIRDAKDIWEQADNSRNLPLWMKKYFRWHKETRQKYLKPDTWEKNRYLIVTCFQHSRKCGGTADRLSSLPFLVRVAAATGRLLLIKWGRPAELEEFLLPPQNGCDWRVPPWLYPLIMNAGQRATVQDVLLELAQKTDLGVLRIRFQSHDHGANHYNMNKAEDESTFQTVFRDLWNIFFTPSPPVANMIETFLEQNGLAPNHYAAAHLRALYGVKDRDPQYVTFWARNAVNCISQLNKEGGPMFFASDSPLASTVAADWGMQHNALVITRQVENEPLHLDKASRWEQRKPSEYYDAFVDLYILALSRCVAYSMGGYGKLAAYLSFDYSCSIQHHWSNGMLDCQFRQWPHTKIHKLEKPLFLPSMPLMTNDKATTSRVPHQDAPLQSMVNGEPKRPANYTSLQPSVHFFPDPKHPVTTNLWDQSMRLPQWMKNYFTWHQSQRKSLNSRNWNESRYLVVACLEEFSKCGGTADRLRPIPFFVRLAAETKRLLLIRWEKPKPLEAFLLPPLGGINWRIPEWLIDEVKRTPAQFTASSVSKAVSLAKGDDVIVRTRVQANDHGNGWYNERGHVLGEPPDAFRQHYRDCWYSLFTPVPPLAKLIEQEMEKLGLTPGRFAYAHVRALYGVEAEGRDPVTIQNWTINALNCLSNIRPPPYFLSSDSEVAREIASKYSKLRNVTIATRLDAKPILHLDLVDDYKTRSSREFYEIFVDLYLMSFGRCMTYNVGGFGKWAQLLSGSDFTCNVRHWTPGVGKNTAKKEGCHWTDPMQTHEESLFKNWTPPLFLPPAQEVT